VLGGGATASFSLEFVKRRVPRIGMALAAVLDGWEDHRESALALGEKRPLRRRD